MNPHRDASGHASPTSRGRTSVYSPTIRSPGETMTVPICNPQLCTPRPRQTRATPRTTTSAPASAPTAEP